MLIRLPYGDQIQEADVSWGRCLGVLDIAEAPGLADIPRAVRTAIEQPIGMDGSLLAHVRRDESVLIVVSDSFRYTGADRFLPPLLDALAERGVRDADVRLIFATGTHRSPTESEQERILGPEVYARFRRQLVLHHPHDAGCLAFAGTTSRGTRVYINRLVQESAHVIVTGAVVLHYFGGFGGGRKSIVPGLAGVETIAHNHALNLHPFEPRLDPAVRIGALDGNPVAEDMLEATRLCRVTGIVNTVLNRHGEIVNIFAGELDAAHRAAAQCARALYAVSIEQPADLVIASAGNARNFVQSHKALFNAFQAMRPGGRLVFLAACPEGLGGNKLQRWLSLGSREAVIAELRKNAEINGQTALSTLEKAPSAFMVTELDAGQTALLGARKAASLSDALDHARSELAAAGNPNPTYYVMPSAAYTVPFVTPRNVT